jgi:hypothetical protein
MGQPYSICHKAEQEQLCSSVYSKANICSSRNHHSKITADMIVEGDEVVLAGEEELLFRDDDFPSC